MKYTSFFIVFLFLTYFTSCSPRMKRFICNGEGKALGLKFSIDYPGNWKMIEGTSPHILKTFDFNDNGVDISLNIYVKKLEEAPSEDQINYLFQRENILNALGDVTLLDFTNDNKIAWDLKCLTVSGYKKGKVYDFESYTLFQNNQFFLNIYHLQFNFFIMSKKQNYEEMLKMYMKYKPVFREMMYTLSLNSRWE